MSNDDVDMQNLSLEEKKAMDIDHDHDTTFHAMLASMHSLTRERDAALASLGQLDGTLSALSSVIALASSLDCSSNSTEGVTCTIEPISLLKGNTTAATGNGNALSILCRIRIENLPMPSSASNHGDRTTFHTRNHSSYDWNISIISLPSDASSVALIESIDIHSVNHSSSSATAVHNSRCLQQGAWMHTVQIPFDPQELPGTVAILLWYCSNNTRYNNSSKGCPLVALLCSTRVDALHAMLASSLSHPHSHHQQSSSSSTTRCSVRIALPKSVFGLHPSPQWILHRLFLQSISTKDTSKDTSKESKPLFDATELFFSSITDARTSQQQAVSSWKSTSPAGISTDLSHCINQSNNSNKNNRSLLYSKQAIASCHYSVTVGIPMQKGKKMMYSSLRHSLMDVTLTSDSLLHTLQLHECLITRLQAWKHSFAASRSMHSGEQCDKLSFPDGTVLSFTTKDVPLVEVPILDEVKKDLVVLKERLKNLAVKGKCMKTVMVSEVEGMLGALRHTTNKVPVKMFL